MAMRYELDAARAIQSIPMDLRDLTAKVERQNELIERQNELLAQLVESKLQG